LNDSADAAEFDLTLAFEQVAQKVAAGDSFTTAQQNAAAQLLEISAAVRELAAETRAAQDRDGVRGALVARAAARCPKRRSCAPPLASRR
jgi:hypothetical protein